MITIFTNPRPFVGIFDNIQRNAIKSWMRLQPECEIVLFEDEQGTTSKVAEEFGLKCIMDCRHNEFGTPLLDDVFAKVQKAARGEIIAQVNADIILMNDFVEAVNRAKEILNGKKFFMIGRRWDLDVNGAIDFDKADWKKKLLEDVKKQGKLHGLAGLDYWVFPRVFQFNPPAFIIGRPGMDSWLIFQARRLKVPVIDATEMVTIIHQNHNYPRKKSDSFGIEVQRNLDLAGGLTNTFTLRDADWALTGKGLTRPKFPKRIFSILSLFYPWQLLLSVKRKIQRLKNK